ncbi:MAG TPA: FtsX-like permease family protein [Anaerolineae bacterium]|nr:FtsX-like permease family protein [Anaerolineae bacterium]
MSAVLIKIKADLISRPLISALILVTIIASSTLLTLALATILNITGPYDRTFQELNGAHVWLYLNRSVVDAGDLVEIQSLPAVAERSELQHYVVARARIGDERTWVMVRDLAVPPPAVGRVRVEEGRYLDTQAAEVVASSILKETHGLAAGEVVEITTADGTPVELPVAGLAYDATWDWYASEQPPPLFVSPDTLYALFPDDSRWGWAIGLRLHDPEAVDELVTAIEDTVDANALLAHVDWRDIRESALFAARINFVFLGAFGFFAIVATILVAASSIGSIVLSQFRQIGVLKAVGFTQGQVLELYVGQYLILSLIGAPIGLLIGIVLAPLPLQAVATALSTSYRPPVDAPLILIVAGIVTATVLLSTLGAGLRGARAPIIRSMAVGAEAPRKKAPWLVRVLKRAGVPPVWILGINDLSSRPVRSLLTGTNLVLGVLGIVFGLAINETVNAYRENPALLGIAHDAIVTRETLSHAETREVLANTPAVEAFYGERQVKVETPGGESYKIRAVEGDLPAFPIRIEQGRLLRPGTLEAIAGRGLLDWLGLGIGDTVTAYLEGDDNKPVTWRIVGQYPEPANMGRMLTVNLQPIRESISQPDPDTYLLKLSSAASRVDVVHAIEPADDSPLSVAFVDEAISDEVISLQWAIFGLSAILIGIALVNVFNTSLLAVQERVRVIGIYKTVGMTPGQVVVLVSITAALLGLQSTVLGIPVGLLLTRSLLDMLAANFGFGQVDIALNPLHLALLVPLIVLISTAGSLLPARWAAAAPIVDVLRSE